MTRVFISFTEPDRPLMQHLYKLLEEHDKFEPHVVERQRTPNAEYLSELIIDGIQKSPFFIPIITENSIHTQWVNQEIGFAKSSKGVNILPIVETEIKENLKGFIHSQIQLNYRFSNSNSEKSFESICRQLVVDLESMKVPKSREVESEETKMKRLDVKPSFECTRMLIGPPTKMTGGVSEYSFNIRNVGEGYGLIHSIKSIPPTPSYTAVDIRYSTPRRIQIGEDLEISIPDVQNRTLRKFEFIIEFFDKYGNSYHQVAGQKEGNIKSDPVYLDKKGLQL